MESSQSPCVLTDSPNKKKSETTPKKFINTLKKNNIRIFAYRDKYVLVNSHDFVFLMFEKIPKELLDGQNKDSLTIKLVDFTVICKLSSLPVAYKIPFSKISMANLKYMCEIYSDTNFLNRNFKTLKERVHHIMTRYNISAKFAKYISKFRDPVSLEVLCNDMREAKFYLEHKPEWSYILQEGYEHQKVEILKKLLPLETFKIFELDSGNEWVTATIINEIFSIK